MATDTAPTENRVRFRGWLTAEEAAAFLGVKRDYIYRLKSVYDSGGSGVPGFLLGDSERILMFRTTDLEAYRRTHPNLGKLRAQPDDDEDDDEDDEESEEDTEEEPEPEPEPEPAPAEA